MQRRRVRAPSVDGGLLVQPAWTEIPGTLRANQQALQAWSHDFQGRDAIRLRQALRQDILDRSRAWLTAHGLQPPRFAAADPLIVTGHQPELFHPGVWAKNFACSRLAHLLGGAALNLIVDNDIPHRTAILVPTRREGGLARVRVEYDHDAGDTPYEDYRVRDAATFARFGPRVRQTLGDLLPDPLVDTFWRHVQQQDPAEDRPGLRFALARHAIERDWGFGTHEAPLSSLCQTEGFRWFACHLLAHLEHFRAVHNAALLTYRRVYRLRSPRHPVPALQSDGTWQEAPFWVWRSHAPRRRPLLVRQANPGLMELRIAGEEPILAELPLGPDRDACCAVERLHALEAAGVRLRTRALTTTIFARLLVGDLFLHGIGGAKYDELGDAIIRGFFHLEPPAFVTLSLTQWMELPGAPTTRADLAAIDRRLRDLTYNPDRLLPADTARDPQLAALAAARRQAVDAPTDTRRQRIERYRAIRHASQQLQPAIAPLRAAAEADRQRILADLALNQVAHDRQAPFPLHSARHLRARLTALATETVIRNGLTQTKEDSATPSGGAPGQPLQ